MLWREEGAPGRPAWRTLMAYGAPAALALEGHRGSNGLRGIQDLLHRVRDAGELLFVDIRFSGRSWMVLCSVPDLPQGQGQLWGSQETGDWWGSLRVRLAAARDGPRISTL